MGVLSDQQIRKEVSITPFEEGVKRPGKISYGLSSYGYDIRAGYKFKVFTNVWGSVVDPKNFDPNAFVNVDLTPLGCDWSDDPDEENRWTCKKCGNVTYDLDSSKFHNRPCGGSTDHVLIPPNSFALAESMERFKIPRDTLAIVLGKSTYARCGIILNCTPLEPEWEGVITLEISNTTPLPAKIYAAEGIGQVYFLRSDERLSVLLDALIHKAGYTDFSLLEELKKAALGSCEVSYASKQGKYQNQTGLTLPQVDGGK